MKRLATLIALTLILSTPLLARKQHENTRIGENAKEAKKAAKDQGKINRKLAAKQRKAMKRQQRSRRRTISQQQKLRQN